MKRIMSILLASGIAFSSFTAFAGEVVASEDFITPYEDAAVKSNEPTTEEMEAMIKKVRPLITIPEDYTVIVCADHGGHDRSHGSDLPEDMTIPVCIRGPKFEKGQELENVSIKDIATTVASLLEVPAVKEWEGKVLE